MDATFLAYAAAATGWGTHQPARVHNAAGRVVANFAIQRAAWDSSIGMKPLKAWLL
jgi:hypothetical protein